MSKKKKHKIKDINLTEIKIRIKNPQKPPKVETPKTVYNRKIYKQIHEDNTPKEK